MKVRCDSFLFHPSALILHPFFICSAPESSVCPTLANPRSSTPSPAPARRRRRTIPFCTIDPNVGVVTVPDARLEVLAKLSHSQKIIPAAIEFVDIAGLVKGASAGEGLGNQFLSHIREVNAIVQVVRCFENADIHHVSGTVDPVRDIEVINTELILADLAAAAETSRPTAERRPRRRRQDGEGGNGGDAKSSCRISTPASRRSRSTLSDEEKKLAARLFPAHLASRRSSPATSPKPIWLRIADAKDRDECARRQRTSRAVQDYARSHFDTEAVVISAQIESELVDLSRRGSGGISARPRREATAASARSSARSIICSACAPISPPAKRKRAPGRSTPATRRPPRPA